MNRPEVFTKLTEGFRGAWRRPGRLLAMLSLVAMIAAACGSDATSTVAADVDDTTTTTTEVESVTTTTTTTTAEPEPEPESESTTSPDADVAVAEMAAAWSSGDADLAWSFDSPRCQGGLADPPDWFAAGVAEWAEFAPDGTAVNITVDVFGDVGAASYDIEDASGEVIAVYDEQPYLLVDGNWLRDQC